MPWIPGIIGVMTFPYLFGRHFPLLIKKIISKGKLNNKFKQVFDNLDEAIIIFNKEYNSISYVNEHFYK